MNVICLGRTKNVYVIRILIVYHDVLHQDKKIKGGFTMDFSDLFDFGHRVTEDKTMSKVVNNQEVVKQIRGSFNWLAAFFSLFYAIFSQKYKTKGFVAKIAVPFVVMFVANLVFYAVLGNLGRLLSNIAGFVWVGMMFDTWFEHQLIANGYHEQMTNQMSQTASSSNSNQDFE